MKSRLFPPGRVALVVNSLLFTPPALAARTLLRRRAAGCPNSLLRSRLRPCQTKKPIDFIWHVVTWDWYKPSATFALIVHFHVLSATRLQTELRHWRHIWHGPSAR